MKTLALLTAVSALLAASVAQASTPTGPGRPTVTLHFFDLTTSDAATISEQQQPKLGDRFYSHDNIYKWNGAKRGALVGHADTTFVVLAPNLGEVSGVATLPGCTLTIEGQAHFTSVTNTFPIVGGTGRYATARGEVTVRTIGAPDSNRSAITVRLWL